MPDRAKQSEEEAPLQARLRELVKASGGSVEFSRRSGVPRDTLNKYLGGMQPSPAALIRLADAGKVSIDYLVGRVDDLAGSGIAITLNQHQVPSAVEPVTDFVMVPRLDVAASAGQGRAVVSADPEQLQIGFRADWLRSLGVSPRNAEFIVAEGDSMLPTIHSGDLLLIDRGIDHVRTHGIYVFVAAGLVSVKRLQPLFDGSMRIVSDNAERYPAEIVPASEVHQLHVVGRVVWFGRDIR